MSARGSIVHIRPFAAGDGPRVCELFIAVNRLLAPPQLQEAFEAYIARSLREEIGRIEAYYGERGGWNSGSPPRHAA